ncbi:NADH-quinone oxidoreductase subunit J [Buchnera aphidicola]|uniref:NADH-quinone oxidoreductase subunit J n=1 Tax=Buchnera aphidicola (Therioaphis trifolii) TaxID=1241884 RepID=A0A4D6YDK5_9GAMM|nr:NADH-quinone oxidoreductase subunit J [Buchnera aphidicola]QCI27122.1 NADH-quinone oxidoreductase subunit J [Buchnera aphidicola (Therioaphis trifolii)]
MYLIFYFFSFLTILFTFLTIIQSNLMYSLFYFSMSVLTTSFIFFLLGNYFIGSLQIIIYSGAILVLFIFVIMLLNYDVVKNGIHNMKFNYLYLSFLISLFFCVLYKIFFILKIKYIVHITDTLHILGINLFKPYLFIIELISILLLSIVLIVFLITKNKK